MAPRDGTSANLGLRASMLGSPSMAEKLLWGMIPPSNKENVEKLNLDQAVTKFFHVVSQVSIRLQA